MSTDTIRASDLHIEVYVAGAVWWRGNRMPPEEGYHCVFEGSAEDYWASDNLSVSEGTAHEVLDWDDTYIISDGIRYDDLGSLPCEFAD